MSTLFPNKTPAAKPEHKTSFQLAQEAAKATAKKATAEKTTVKKTTTTKK